MVGEGSSEWQCRSWKQLLKTARGTRALLFGFCYVSSKTGLAVYLLCVTFMLRTWTGLSASFLSVPSALKAPVFSNIYFQGSAVVLTAGSGGLCKNIFRNRVRLRHHGSEACPNYVIIRCYIVHFRLFVEIEMILKEAAFAQSKGYNGICLEKLKKTTMALAGVPSEMRTENLPNMSLEC